MPSSATPASEPVAAPADLAQWADALPPLERAPGAPRRAASLRAALSPQQALAAGDLAAFEQALERDPGLRSSPLALVLAKECATANNPAALRALLGFLAPARGPQITDIALLAIRLGHAGCLAELTPFCAQPDSPDALALLMSACAGESAECLEALLPVVSPQALCAVNEATGLERTPLMRAAVEGSQAVVEWLLPRSDPRAALPSGHNALTLAASAPGKADNVRALLPFCDPAHRMGLGSTALMLAAGAGDLESVKALAPVSNLRARNQAQLTALSLAARNGRAETADFLACLDPTALSAKTAFESLGPAKMPQYAAWRERRALLREIMETRAAHPAQPAASGDAGAADSATDGEAASGGEGQADEMGRDGKSGDQSQGRGARRL